MAFNNIDTAFDMVKLQSGIAESDDTRDDYITDILERSKGLIGEVTAYRPYLVAALTMWTSKGEQTITEASGSAKFRYEEDRMNLRPAIEANLRIQKALDVGVEIPEGWEIDSWLDALCGCPKTSTNEEEVNTIFATMVV